MLFEVLIQAVTNGIQINDTLPGYLALVKGRYNQMFVLQMNPTRINYYEKCMVSFRNKELVLLKLD